MVKKSRGKFRYRGDKRSVESVVRKSKQSGGMYDSYILNDVQLLKLKEGDTTLRILPPSWPEEDDKEWGDGWDIEIWIHFGVGPDNASYLCSDQMGRGPCPMCEARRDADEDEQRELKPSWRALAWVIDRNNEKAGPQVWSMPVTVFREINLRSVDKKHNTPIPIDSPEEGYDITFAREGTGIKTKYEAFEVDRDPSPLHEDEEVQEKWLSYIEEHPLPDILNYYDPEHIKKVLYGTATSRAEDDDEPPEERASRSDRRRRASDDDDEDTPRRSRSSRRRDDEDEDEDGEEEAPRSRSRRRDDGGGALVRVQGQRRRRAEPEDEPEEPDDEEEEEADEPEGDDNGEEEGDPSSQARSRLGKLKGKRSGRARRRR